MLVLRIYFFDYLCETLYKHALKQLEAARPEKNVIFFLPTVNAWILFERSEFLIATCEKKKTDRLCGCVCVDARLISWF